MDNDKIVIVKNPSNTNELILKDFGISISSSSLRDLTHTEEYIKICKSSDLKDKVINGNAIINNGSEDLELEDAIKHITINSEYRNEEFSIAMAMIFGA